AVGIVHRDVKPENVFLHNGPTGEVVKVVDFGIAKLLDEQAVSESAITSAHAALGTPLYMAPEQMCNAPSDGRADVYSLAMMVYEMLTGALPFDEGHNFVTIAMVKMRDEPMPMRTRDPAIPRLLDEVVLSALRREPAERPT